MRHNNRPMGVTKIPPILVPILYQHEVMKLSKAALADIAWNLAARCVNSADDIVEVMDKFREERDVTLRNQDTYRKME